uniref:prepilin-type N-terminal cleavage/methylation domain-containing protein n=1 Tax=Candidatus Scatousia sp. TaxID=3085663 RepID=UPI0040289A2A
MRYKAFTLAEVLITLGIIGIVASMTLPTLVGKYKKVQTISQLKKTYTVLNQAFRHSEADNESSLYWNVDNG